MHPIFCHTFRLRTVNFRNIFIIIRLAIGLLPLKRLRIKVFRWIIRKGVHINFYRLVYFIIRLMLNFLLQYLNYVLTDFKPYLLFNSKVHISFLEWFSFHLIIRGQSIFVVWIWISEWRNILQPTDRIKICTNAFLWITTDQILFDNWIIWHKIAIIDSISL